MIILCVVFLYCILHKNLFKCSTIFGPVFSDGSGTRQAAQENRGYNHNCQSDWVPTPLPASTLPKEWPIARCLTHHSPPSPLLHLQAINAFICLTQFSGQSSAKLSGCCRLPLPASLTDFCLVTQFRLHTQTHICSEYTHKRRATDAARSLFIFWLPN